MKEPVRRFLTKKIVKKPVRRFLTKIVKKPVRRFLIELKTKKAPRRSSPKNLPGEIDLRPKTLGKTQKFIYRLEKF